MQIVLKERLEQGHILPFALHFRVAQVSLHKVKFTVKLTSHSEQKPHILIKVIVVCKTMNLVKKFPDSMVTTVFLF